MHAIRRKSIGPESKSMGEADLMAAHGRASSPPQVRLRARPGWSRHAAQALLFALLLWALPGALEPPSELEPQYAAAAAIQVPDAVRFDAARAALGAGEQDTFEQLTATLEGHPLQAELQRAELHARIDRAEASEVRAFLERYPGSVPAERIRHQWLARLAREGRWTDYLEDYVDDGSTQRECWYRRALLATGRAADRTTGPEAQAFAGLTELYLTARSLPAACDPLFAAWYAAGGLDSEQVWARVERALAHDNAGVAAYQARYLPSTQQPWLERLVDVHRRPEQLLEAPLTAEQVPDALRRQHILVHGLQRLAERAPAQAELLRASIAAAETLPAALAERADAAVGQALVRAGDARGLDALARLEPRADNIDLQLARLQTALRARAWSRLAAWSRGLPAAADELGKWRYWRGQALMRVATSAAERAAAAHAFASAARERTLWGFLSAELIGRPLALDHQSIPVAADAVETLLASETIAPIQALQVLGRDEDVAREWRALTRSMSREQRLAAAAAAARLGLVNESILTLARAAYWDDLELRFPLAHRSLVHDAAAEQGLPLDWVYAVIRQESAFAPGAASHAGAIGLMQLMPATAREVASKTGRPPPERPDLIDPALNIALGTTYLAEMQRRFNAHPLVASAAYNAGPTAVRRWLPEAPMPGALWMTEIPYAETRQYVRRVLTYRVIYRYRLGLEPLRVGALLRPVP
ncbi:lytic transglycosylase domain-containing protein [Halochromatium salexigens]|uniref:Soluble lytic murein transglycosylase n=1 Tax=Halochromatium salexigens TaxID=49447 RepID=A0AAJ0UGC0_HALSE|nr:lytic transglycosylase domain-containing protein [Halochromatium salexigens]MBK5930942.1 hypothetical protein [Halochromatium salexigens]